MVKKLSSRKFLACIAGVVIGIAMILGLSEDTIQTVAGAVTAMASVVAYIITEGRIDAAGVALAAQDINAVFDAVKDEQEALEDGKGD